MGHGTRDSIVKHYETGIVYHEEGIDGTAINLRSMYIVER